MIWQDQKILAEIGKIYQLISEQANTIKSLQAENVKLAYSVSDLQKSAPILQSSELTSLKADLDEIKKRLFTVSPYTGKKNLSPYAKLLRKGLNQ